MLSIAPTKRRRIFQRRNAIIAIAVFLLLSGGAGAWWLRSHQAKVGDQNIFLPEVIEMKAVAKDVNAYGSATRVFATRGVQGAYLHTIKVRLPEILTPGIEYYAWLAKPDKSHYIKTGKLIKYPTDEMYHLDFRDTKDYEGYDLVLVTAEQKDDGAPELILMEGKFK
jgi:hypothetical protein